MKDSKVLKKNPNMVTRQIEDETILMPLYTTSKDIKCIYTLNDMAAGIWRLIDGKKSLGRIKKILLEEFDVTEEKLDKELAEFFKDLQEAKAIT